MKLLVLAALLFGTPGSHGHVNRDGRYDVTIARHATSRHRIIAEHRYRGRLPRGQRPAIRVRVWEDGSWRIGPADGCLAHGLCVD